VNPFDPGYYNEEELREIGFKAVGNNVHIAKNNTIIGVENISIADNVRIDGYCTIVAGDDGWLELGSYIHVVGYSVLSAGDGIRMEDFSGLSQGVNVYSRSDAYTGKFLINPTVPERYKGVHRGTVTLERHVSIGTGAVILPKLTIAEGSAVGALALVTKSLDSWGIYGGCPAKRLKDRSKNLLELEAQLRQEDH
jgi:acetyltransferase-like isoleucine patch superfamily enzyme